MGRQQEARSIARTLLAKNFEEELKRCKEELKAKKESVGYDALAVDAPARAECDELEKGYKRIAAARQKQFDEWKKGTNVLLLHAIIIAELRSQRNLAGYLDSYQEDMFRGLGEKLREQNITHADMVEEAPHLERRSRAGSVCTVGTVDTAGDVDVAIDEWDAAAEREREQQEVARKALLEEKERTAAIEKMRRELAEKTRDEARKQREEAEKALAVQQQEAAARQKELEAQRRAEEAARQKELEAQRRVEEAAARQQALEARQKAEEDAKRAVSQPVFAPRQPTQASPLPQRRHALAGKQAGMPVAGVEKNQLLEGQPQPQPVPVPAAPLVSMPPPAPPLGSVQQQADEKVGKRCCFCFWRNRNFDEQEPLLSSGNTYIAPHQ